MLYMSASNSKVLNQSYFFCIGFFNYEIQRVSNNMNRIFSNYGHCIYVSKNTLTAHMEYLDSSLWGIVLREITHVAGVRNVIINSIIILKMNLSMMIFQSMNIFITKIDIKKVVCIRQMNNSSYFD